MDLKIMVKNNSILLDLEMTTDVINLNYNQVFQTEAREAIFKKIADQLKQQNATNQHNYTDNNYNDLFYDRHHNAITISGPRGSGKSTFLRHILTCLYNYKIVNATEEQKNEIPQGLEVLKIIDPTLISSKEHVLIILISQIRDAVSKYSKSCSDNDYQTYEQTLKELAGGLCQIDGIGSSAYGDEWEDKTYILEKGLEKASEGRNLERNLNKFVNAALAAIDKKAFVITFDDIDTKFEKGWPVLETIRKYLTSSKFIILISGDIELYSTLVRGAQFKSLGEHVTNFDRPSRNFHSDDSLGSYGDDQVIRKASELEEQYMMKVLKPENRVNMLTLHQKASRVDNYSTNILLIPSFKNKESSILLDEFLNEYIFQCYGISHKKEQEKFRKGILSLPIRTLLQFLKAISDHFEVKKCLNSDNKSSMNVTSTALDSFTSAIINIFGLSFSRSSLKLSDLTTSEFSLVKMAETFWKWAIEENVWKEFDRMNLVQDNDILNSRMIVFFTLIAKHIKFNPSSGLSLMIYTAMPKHIALFRQPSDTKTLRKIDILDYVGISEKNTNIFESTKKGLLAQLVSGGNLRDMGLYLVPRYKKIGLVFEFNLARFYNFEKIDLAMIAIDKAKDSKQKKEIRETLKVDYHRAINEFDDFDNAGVMKGWLREIKKVYDENTDLSNEVIGIIYNTIESVEETYDLGYLINLACISTKGYRVGHETNFVSSISYLSAIFDLLNKDFEDSDKLENSIKTLCAQEKYLLPTWFKEGERSRGDEDETDTEKVSVTQKIPDYEGKFFSRLNVWLKVVKKNWHKLNISGSQLVNVFEQLMDNLEDVNKAEPALGQLLHMQVVSFLQHALVSDALKAGNFKLTSRAISSSEIEFHKNYLKFISPEFSNYEPNEKEANKTKAKYDRMIDFHRSMVVNDSPTLFSIILSCPLIGLLLKTSSSSSDPKYWDWLRAHSSYYLTICEDEKLEFFYDDDNNTFDKDLIELNKIKSVSDNLDEYEALLKKYYPDYISRINDYLADLNVSGFIKDTKLDFSNLYDLFNSIPITDNDKHKYKNKSVGVELNLKSENDSKAVAPLKTDDISEPDNIPKTDDTLETDDTS
ncbi:hypothetical protein, partial [Pseudoalteromonas sp. SG43-3]|uniref:hypothetical protein n=1 Tax=Pseudoalteromonas sp. SG43-3 TaxID=2760970 RepID=UPI00183F9723